MLYLVERRVTDRTWVEAPDYQAASRWLERRGNDDDWGQGGGEEYAHLVQEADKWRKPPDDLEPVRVDEMGREES